ncbi:histone-lysine N-methyltransferase 2D [Caerostris extrusa]|uniref:Histone-lysine N-methyltransferase 2D n=1 Tax=Caerostris extrusa TaxID=172846 RepID=A0AAV4UAF7_CAEEX|nr:histone-lysine N-methyltransferase 2D [Caerostris extrusa]
MTNIIKEEPKQSFSSCSLPTQTFSPGIEIKMEKDLVDTCNIQKQHNITFSTDSPTLSSVRSGIQCPEQLIPPPSYRMVTALKQTLGGHVPQNALPPQNKNVFPLHLNMNLRQDLPLNQQNVLSPVPSNKPLLLQEQPLLLEDLVEQEKREQRRQTQESLMSPHGDALLSDIDFERLKDDVFSGPPDDSLGGPGSLLSGHDPALQAAVSSVGVSSSSGSHNFGPPPYSLLWQSQESAMQLGPRPLTIMQNLKTKPPVSAVVGSFRLSKQFRQNSIALQDYRLKQQKRQQQPHQTQQPVPRSPLHTNVSSLQSSPQNSQSPLQFSHITPQSSMMPPSPVGPPNSIRIQHSPSSLMQPPVSLPSPHSHQQNIHSPLFSQQLPLQFQVTKTDGKNWPASVKMQQVDSLQASERFAKRESFESSLSSQAFSMSGSSNSPLSETNLKGLMEMKKSQSDDALAKKLDSPSVSINIAEDSFVVKQGNLDIGQVQNLHRDQKSENESTADPAVSQSILSQSLPSSVSNTLKFTLRQTGMPTGCLPTDGTSDNPSELAFSSPTLKFNQNQ